MKKCLVSNYVPLVTYNIKELIDFMPEFNVLLLQLPFCRQPHSVQIEQDIIYLKTPALVHKFVDLYILSLLMGLFTFSSFCNYLHLNNLIIEHLLSVSYLLYLQLVCI